MRLALAGDTMLGRGVAQAIQARGPTSLFSEAVKDAIGGADLFVLNLECCISSRGARWPDPNKPFFFRAPPRATETLVDLDVDCVTLANNHALDYGVEALADTVSHLTAAGIAVVGAGEDVEQARRPASLSVGGWRLDVIGVTDHPEEFAAGTRPGVAFADLWTGTTPDWLLEAISGAASQADAVLVTPHWGPNMTSAPPPHVRSAAETMTAAGASLIAGHSAHVFHGVSGSIIYDMGDFVDDYAVDRELRNDLGLVFLVDFEAHAVKRIEAIPLALEYCHTRLATGRDADWIRRRFVRACAELDTLVIQEDSSLVIELG